MKKRISNVCGIKSSYISLIIAGFFVLLATMLFANYGMSKAVADGEVAETQADATISLALDYDTSLGASASLDKKLYALGDRAVLTWKGKSNGDNFVIPVSVRKADGTTLSISSINKVDELQTANTEYERRMNQAGTMTEYDTVKAYVEAEHTIDLGIVSSDATLTVEFAKVAPVYRMYNVVTSEHLFSTNKAEYDNFVALGKTDSENWVGEGIDWLAPTTTDNTKVVHRLYNEALGQMGHTSHYYTSDETEISNLCSNWGWTDDGSANQFRSGGTTPIYTCYNEALGSAHHYTSSKSEWEGLMQHGWALEEDKNGTNPAKDPEGVFQCGIGTSWSFSGNYYTVKHNLEGLDGTYATEAVQVKQANGSMTNAVALAYPGFTAQSFTQKSINGNSTVVEINYKRNSYAINYVTNDPTVTIPKKDVKYRETLTGLAQPSTNNKDFLGWYLDKELTQQVTDSDLMSASNLTVYAKWSPEKLGKTDANGMLTLEDQNTSDDIVFKLTTEAGEPVEGAEITLGKDGSAEITLPEPGVYDDEVLNLEVTSGDGNGINDMPVSMKKSNGTTDRGEGSTSGNGDFKFDRFVLKFWMTKEKLSSASEDQVVFSGMIPQMPTEPSRSGYSFASWRDVATDEAFDLDITPTKDADLYAKWIRSLDNCTIELNGSLVYDGSLKTQSVVVKDNDKELVEGQDYVLEGNKQTEAGDSYTLTVSGIRDYFGTASKKWTIEKADISVADVKLGSSVQPYTGGEQTQTLDSVVVNGRTLTALKDFDISGNKQTNAGKYTITLTGRGNYKNSKTVDWTIEPASIGDAYVSLGQSSFPYDGTQKVVPVDGVSYGGKDLDPSDYKITGDRASDAGDYELVVEGQGNYAGTTKAAWKIVPATLTLLWTSTETTYNGQTQSPSVSISTGKIATDDVKVALADGSSQSQAGDYTALAVLEGTSAKNYTIDASSLTHSFKIAKAAAKISVSGVAYAGAGDTLKSVFDLPNFTVLGANNEDIGAGASISWSDESEVLSGGSLTGEDISRNVVVTLSPTAAANYSTSAVPTTVKVFSGYAGFWFASKGTSTGILCAEQTVKQRGDEHYKSANRIKADAAAIKANKPLIIAEYKQYMSNDNVHLYTNYGDDQSVSNGYAEFRIIHVGEHQNGNGLSDNSSLTFQTTHLLAEAYATNSSQAVNTGGWEGTTIKGELNNSSGSIYAKFNGGLTKAITQVSKSYSASDDASIASISSSNKFFLLSFSELTGTAESWTPQADVEGGQYDYFKNNNVITNSKNSCLVLQTRDGNQPSNFEGTGSEVWVLRTRQVGNTQFFAQVTSEGKIVQGNTSPKNNMGVAPAFCF